MRSLCPFLCSLIISSLLFCRPPAEAQEGSASAPDHQPQICTSYWSELSAWSTLAPHYEPRRQNCPKNQVLMAIRPRLKRKLTPAETPDYVSLHGTCCPLPAADMLTSEISIHPVACPENSVAVGASLETISSDCWVFSEGEFRTDNLTLREEALDRNCHRERAKSKTLLHCAKINTKRYQLSEARGGLRHSLSDHLRYLWFDDFTTQKMIPPALRYGIGRRAQREWLDSFCLGYPWGSPFVAKNDKLCNTTLFRQFQFRGIAGDPPGGTAVKMYPDCLAIKEPLSNTPICVNPTKRSKKQGSQAH